ncbi:hypothetical protein [Herpetosiphon giganteus]|uniref:hypothetical protein n=1 Tax=Herpetosiphon giganteus TaxID=2029754 RepID=UPI0019572B6D|nr:hypothetical protein [Herpetosiphon giganteus]MBM7844317.1 GNAT superfamily N-acetyltransferase [Herpetosiphon giganteus]
MVPLQIVAVRNAKQRQQFIRFPWQVYRGANPDPLWVPPLLLERERFFNPKHGGFFAHGDVQLFLAQRGTEIVGTISAHINFLHNRTHNEQIGFFGFFEVLDDPEAAAALLQTACDWVRDRGYKAIRGPMNFSINDECGLLIEGFERAPVMMMTYNPPRYVEYIEQAGFGKKIDLYAWVVDQQSYAEKGRGPKIERVAALAQAQTGLTFRKLNMRRFSEEVEAGWHVYNQAWANNWGAIHMTLAEFRHLAYSFKPFLDPEVMIVAEDQGRMVGLLIAVPDINIPLRYSDGRLLPFGWLTMLRHKREINQMRVLIMGVLPEYRRRGIDAVFYREVRNAGLKRGYHTAEMSWILENNDVMNNTIAGLGGRCYKTYRIYEKKLT